MRLPLTALPLLLATPAFADLPRVATDIAPVHSLVAQVMVGVGVPDLIVDPGASPHGYALRPSQARDLSQADAVFMVSHALTPWLEGPVDSLAGDALVVELLDAPGVNELMYRDQIAFGEDDHGAQDTHDDHAAADAHDDHDHAHEGVDAHAWLDPENARVWVQVIAEDLSSMDPDHADTYRANAAEAEARLADLQQDIAVRMAPLADVPFITFHDAYQYFEHRFGLSGVGAISLGDASAPSAARIAEIRELVTDRNVVCVFSEPQFNPALVETVASSSGLSTGVIDPVGASVTPGPDFYAEFLENVADAFQDCLSPS
ncbi:zinc ABC transporter substrate-binding protein [Nioella nitratireducens]|uniref:zinc ABC transporter substrate-binding protein n=1 Tax=Nioella nitratireducens TaxID=1287720 RepID=UPI0008FD2126|nr:zinc ABC transporter substrate-binding protein [Nioella nitratireducens]